MIIDQDLNCQFMRYRVVMKGSYLLDKRGRVNNQPIAKFSAWAMERIRKEEEGGKFFFS